METTFKIAISKFKNTYPDLAKQFKGQPDEATMITFMVDTQIPESFIKVHFDEIQRLLIW